MENDAASLLTLSTMTPAFYKDLRMECNQRACTFIDSSLHFLNFYVSLRRIETAGVKTQGGRIKQRH